ncbi:MAG: gamma-glutamyltransferase [Gammaproteobacteria bacterium]|nr:MAG: gamma-glutamyltransferase [Gammaproteobacteria bacterium]
MNDKSINYKYGAVSSGHRLVSEVGLDILKAGGNAFDAVIACGFASTVCEPMLTSLGGGGFLLTREKGGQTRLFDFFSNHSGLHYTQTTGRAIEPKFLPITVNFPSSDQVFQSGLASVATPGCLHGYFYAHQRLGRLPMQDVVRPAIDLARNGVALTPFQAYAHQLLSEVVLSTPESCAIFARHDGQNGNGQGSDGKLVVKETGEMIFNRDLADFMEILAIEGSDLFYRGEVARQIADDMLSTTGFVTIDDLSHYQTIERQPLTYQNREGSVYGNPPPSSGSTLAFKQLDILSHHQPAGMLDADSQRQWLASFKAVDKWRNQQEKQQQDQQQQSPRLFSRGTTHVSVIDKEGQCAAMTTSNGEGSGYIVPNTGIMLNNMMGEDDLHPHGFYASEAGTRIASMMSPTIAVSDDGQVIAMGSGGSKRIRTAITQVLWQLLHQKRHLVDAIRQPRMHFDGELLQCEPGYEKSLAVANHWQQQDMYFGGVHAVSSHDLPVADNRREGFSVYQ